MSELYWSELYRPQVLDEMVGQEHIIPSLKVYVKRKNMPNLLFVGPPGTGKTTAAWCIANEKYGKHVRAMTLELNASDERGIKTIREKVKAFIRISVAYRLGFKILILDEADHMTGDAQSALRRLMELYAKATRIIFCANDGDKIIKPIASRCTKFNFYILTTEQTNKFLNYIVKAEKLDINPSTEFVSKLIDVYRGDLRLIINTFQTLVESKRELTPENVAKHAGEPPFDVCEKLVTLALDGNFQNAWMVAKWQIYNRGLTARSVLQSVSKNLFDIIKDKSQRLQVAIALGECERSIWYGTSDEVQLQAFLARLASLGGKRPE